MIRVKQISKIPSSSKLIVDQKLDINLFEIIIILHLVKSFLKRIYIYVEGNQLEKYIIGYLKKHV